MQFIITFLIHQPPDILSTFAQNSIFDREIAQALAVLQVTVILLLLGRFCIKIELYGAIANLRLINLIQNSFDSENLNQNQNELLESAESFHSYF